MPQVKCGACARYMAPTDAATCNKCSTLYHRACVALPLKGGKTTVWQCPGCMKGAPRPTKGGTPKTTTLNTSQVEENSSDEFLDTSPSKSMGGHLDVPSITDALRLFKDELRTEMRLMREEFKVFREECAQLRNSLKACNERLDGLDSGLSTLEQRASRAPEETSEIEVIVAQLKDELNDRDQDLLGADLEISNIPEDKGENLMHTVSIMAVKLGITLEERDIVSIDRIGGRYINATSAEGAREVRPRPIIMRLARRNVRDELLRAARVRRGATTCDLGVSGPPRRFFINERLTKRNRQLFRKARDMGHRLGWRYVWTRRGKIFARQKAGDPACPVSSEADLARVFGADTVHTA